MPGPMHQGLLFHLEHNPDLAFELAHQFDAQIGPKHGKFEAARRRAQILHLAGLRGRCSSLVQVPWLDDGEEGLELGLDPALTVSSAAQSFE